MAATVGAPAPEFTLKDQDQKEVKLSDFRGKKVVIVFYPLDWSPVCTEKVIVPASGGVARGPSNRATAPEIVAGAPPTA